jgi:hypothetical protein
LAFHPYPQVIPELFNANGFGPPCRFTDTSTCPWIDHKVSRLPPLTKRPIWTRFRYGSVIKELNLASEEQLVGSLCKRHAVTQSCINAEQAPTACKHTVSGTISLPCLGYFSPFPYGTGSLSVSEEYLALPDGAGRFKQDFSGPALLRIPLVPINVRLRDSHALWSDFPESSA